MDERRPSAKPAAPLPATPRPLQRAADRFAEDPTRARNAVYLIVAADVLVVIVGGLVIWMLDRQEYEHLPTAFWYILQTITTVGYGDVTPVEPIGRVIGGFVMLLGIATLSILTASITSSFIEARQRAHRIDEEAEEDARWAALDARLDAIAARLDRLEPRTDLEPGRD